MKAGRLLSLPPYLFEELERKSRAALAEGRDVIDLSIGDPDIAPPRALVDALAAEVHKDLHHHYPPQRGSVQLKQAAAEYLEESWGQRPREEELLILVGSKEGLAHLPLALCNPGDRVMIPDPGYPVYRAAALLAACRPTEYRLREEDGFLPRSSGEFRRQMAGARLIFLNYPNNPTGAVAEEGFWEEMLDLAADNGTIVANDAAYAEVFSRGRPPLLSGRLGAWKKPVVEFFSFSKMFCIPGWRVAFAVGNPEVIDALGQLKANVDSGVFGAVQAAVAGVLRKGGVGFAEEARRTWGERKEKAKAALTKLGFQCSPSPATFYLWVRVPSPWRSLDFCLALLEKAGVLVTPGVGFGSGGEGYFRVSLTRRVELIEEAVARIGATDLVPR